MEFKALLYIIIFFSGKTIFDKPLIIIYKNENEFDYMLISKYEIVINENNETILRRKI